MFCFLLCVRVMMGRGLEHGVYKVRSNKAWGESVFLAELPHLLQLSSEEPLSPDRATHTHTHTNDRASATLSRMASPEDNFMSVTRQPQGRGAPPPVR